MQKAGRSPSLAEAFEEICLLDAPLNVRLAAYADKLRELNFPFAEAYDHLVARLVAGEVGGNAPAVGELMPPFILPSKNGTLVGLRDLISQGPAVINFNRGHWCPFCKIQLRALADFHDEISRCGAQVASIMPDRQQFVKKLRTETLDRLHILTDLENGYALSLGLVMFLGERLRELMQGRGVHVDTFHGADGWFVPLPATFVVGRDGRVVARYVDPDFKRRMEIDEIIATLRSLS